MKSCSNCHTFKDACDFYKNENSKDGLHSYCKVCVCLKSKSWCQANAIRHCASVRKWQNKNEAKLKINRKIYYLRTKEQSIQKATKWIAANKKKHINSVKQYVKRNPGKSRLWSANNRARRSKSIPRWLTLEHRELIAIYYIDAINISLKTGIPHEVDHIVPLCGKEVSGLHVPWNLQIILMTDNLAKSNKLVA